MTEHKLCKVPKAFSEFRWKCVTIRVALQSYLFFLAQLWSNWSSASWFGAHFCWLCQRNGASLLQWTNLTRLVPVSKGTSRKKVNWFNNSLKLVPAVFAGRTCFLKLLIFFDKSNISQTSCSLCKQMMVIVTMLDKYELCFTVTLPQCPSSGSKSILSWLT